MDSEKNDYRAGKFEFRNGQMAGFCPHCGVHIFREVDNEAIQAASHRNQDVTLASDNCGYCHGLIVLLDYDRQNANSEIIYPKNPGLPALPAEAPDVYRELYDEAIVTSESSPRSSAILCRGLLQLVLHENYQIKSKNLYLEIKELLSHPGIPPYLHKDLDRLRGMGNLAAHPLLDENDALLQVEPSEAQWLLEILRTFLDFSFVKPRRQQERDAKLDKKMENSRKLRERGRPAEPSEE